MTANSFRPLEGDKEAGPDYARIQNKKVLVTGGAGFIGSNLCEDLLQYNNEVICFDNFSTGYKYNIIGFLSNSNFKLIDGDIRVRIIGEEYREYDFTGRKYCQEKGIELYCNARDHRFSTSPLRK